MRLVTYRFNDAIRVGAVHEDQVIDLSELAGDMLGLIEGGPELLAAARERVAHPQVASVALAAVQLLAPIPRPRKNIVCLGMNYAAHAYESMRAKGLPAKLPEYPVFFTKAPTAVNHPEGRIPYDPELSTQMDWEVELAFVIGRRGLNIPAAQAFDYIFGYTILNDISLRDIQNRHQQFFRGKSADGSAPLGPWLVTTDEISNPQTLGLRLRLNGETMQNSSTADLIFDIPTIIATLSRGMTLEPGDIISTGTPSGVGMGMTPPRWLKPGDVVEAEIDEIGILRNTVG
jgi:2-keto-4-pentenoate hydratase/2-oxohepta-3-ene-1,7-dioic acid hydratase in catechol pathway